MFYIVHWPSRQYVKRAPDQQLNVEFTPHVEQSKLWTEERLAKGWLVERHIDRRLDKAEFVIMEFGT